MDNKPNKINDLFSGDSLKKSKKVREPRTFNPLVGSSNLPRPTTSFKYLRQPLCN
jgi:hypothetical protein